MANGIVFLNSEMIFRFLSSGAFEDLAQQHTIRYAVMRETRDMRWKPEVAKMAVLREYKDDIDWLLNYPQRLAPWRELFHLSCIQKQDISTSFALRHRRLIYQNPTEAKRLETLAEPHAYAQHRATIEKQLGYHPAMLEIVLRRKPDFLVLPSSGIDNLYDDVLLIGDTFNIPVLMLTANWDNLSSKGVMHRQPAMLGVWGEQTRGHAINIQSIPSQNVAVMGAPQYPPSPDHTTVDATDYREKLGLPATGKLVLFTGGLRTFDETTLLRAIEDAIEAGELPPFHVLYRPHPWRQPRQHEDNFLAQTWQHVTLDPTLENAYLQSHGLQPNRGLVIFEMDHLFKLYKLVDAQISIMSTVFLEGMMYGLPSMGITYNDGKHLETLEEFSDPQHFKELFDIHELIFAESAADVLACVRELLATTDDPVRCAAIQESSQFFLYQNSDDTYSQRVLAAANAMLSQERAMVSWDVLPISEKLQMLIKHRALASAIFLKDFFMTTRQKLSSQEIT